MSKQMTLTEFAREHHARHLAEVQKAQREREAALHRDRLAVLEVWARRHPDLPLPRTLEPGRTTFEVDGIRFGFATRPHRCEKEAYHSGGYGLTRIIQCPQCGAETHTASFNALDRLVAAVVEPQPWRGHECKSDAAATPPEPTVEERLLDALRLFVETYTPEDRNR